MLRTRESRRERRGTRAPLEEKGKRDGTTIAVARWIASKKFRRALSPKQIARVRRTQNERRFRSLVFAIIAVTARASRSTLASGYDRSVQLLLLFAAVTIASEPRKNMGTTHRRCWRPVSLAWCEMFRRAAPRYKPRIRDERAPRIARALRPPPTLNRAFVARH